MYIPNKPIKRSKLRLLLGKKYYMYKRYIQWIFLRKDYSREKFNTQLNYEVYRHKTPLLRELKGVDMQLQYNKITNLRLAIKRVNGVIIKPKETFSYWRLIGKPSYKKGYKDGLVLRGDGTFEAGVGGGLCQLSNLIYWITLHTPLHVTERYRHSHDIFPDSNRTQPFGSGATCVYNYFDLQIYNPTDKTFQLILYIDDGMLNGQWRCNEEIYFNYEIYEKEHRITPTFWGKYMRSNSIFRRIYDGQKNFIKEEFIAENHAIMMYEPLIE